MVPYDGRDPDGHISGFMGFCTTDLSEQPGTAKEHARYVRKLLMGYPISR